MMSPYLQSPLPEIMGHTIGAATQLNTQKPFLCLVLIELSLANPCHHSFIGWDIKRDL